MNLYVLAMMKNEADILREWINHYKLFGADHIYLIDDDSTDNSRDIAYTYGDFVTVYESKGFPKEQGRQIKAYNEYFSHLVGTHNWALICDIDEFAFPLKHNSLKDVLKEFETSETPQCSQIFMYMCNFGFKPNKIQPKSLVYGCTLRDSRAQMMIEKNLSIKCFTRLDAIKKYEGVHNQNVTGITKHSPLLQLNHYALQSEEHLLKRLIRGGGDHWRKPMTREEAEKYIQTSDWSTHHTLLDETLRDIYIQKATRCHVLSAEINF